MSVELDTSKGPMSPRSGQIIDKERPDSSGIANQPKKKRRIVEHPVPSALRTRFANGISWMNLVWMIGMNVGAVAAFWHFTPAGLITAIVLHFTTACIGITLTYHRLLTHGSFKVSRPVRYLLSLNAMTAAEGSPLFWVATHRKHHVLSDQPGDPHSPNDGLLWSHMLWFKPRTTRQELEDLYQRWAPDMYKDPVQRFFDRIFPLVPIVFGIGLFVIGELTMGSGWSLLLWGLCVRAVACYHSTWLINSASHIWGYRTYETNDRSRNLWWAAMLSYGEGWHNNHHAHQRCACYCHRWWELDITWQLIKLMRLVGLAWDVQDTMPEIPEKPAKAQPA
ncbi:MAG: acyl-CoA desaturase [Planctomycetota bacterium]|jgi:stearoyl-CoA desaturase (delta-9 desaturase)